MESLTRSLVLVALGVVQGPTFAAEPASSRRYLESELRFESEETGSLSGWRVDGADVQLTDEHVKDGKHAARILPFIAVSNDASRDAALSRALTQGECANVRLVVDRDGVEPLESAQ
jgi:hypothetical protein